jgi:hypothetical protein
MLCVEVTLNGKRRCVAAVRGLAAFDARIVRYPGRDGAATTRLEVAGISDDLSTLFVWIADDDRLGEGDVVTFRVVDSKAPDVPVASPSRLSELLSRRRLPDVRTIVRDALEKVDLPQVMLTWLVLLYVAALLQHCPH